MGGPLPEFIPFQFHQYAPMLIRRIIFTALLGASAVNSLDMGPRAWGSWEVIVGQERFAAICKAASTANRIDVTAEESTLDLLGDCFVQKLTSKSSVPPKVRGIFLSKTVWPYGADKYSPKRVANSPNWTQCLLVGTDPKT